MCSSRPTQYDWPCVMRRGHHRTSQRKRPVFSRDSCWQEPEHVFREGNPQPDAELKFWQNRVENSDMKTFSLKHQEAVRFVALLFQEVVSICMPFFDDDFSNIFCGED